MGGFAYPNPNLFHNSYQDVDPAQARDHGHCAEAI